MVTRGQEVTGANESRRGKDRRVADAQAAISCNRNEKQRSAGATSEPVEVGGGEEEARGKGKKVEVRNWCGKEC